MRTRKLKEVYELSLMKLFLTTLSLLCASTVAFYGATEATIATGSGLSLRKWTARDSLVVKYFSQQPSIAGRLNGLPKNYMAPDQKHFYIQTVWCDLKRDCTTMRIDVFAVEAARRWLLADEVNAGVCPAVGSFEGHTRRANLAAVDNVSWTNGGKAIMFTATDLDDRRQVYQIDMQLYETHVMTSSAGFKFWPSLAGSTLLYREDVMTPRATVTPPLVKAIDRTAAGEALLSQLAFPSNSKEDMKSRWTIVMGSTSEWAIASFANAALLGRPPENSAGWLSLDGNWLIANPHGRGYMGDQEYVLVDIRKRSLKTIALAATDGRLFSEGERKCNAVWSNDSRRVVLFNVRPNLADAKFSTTSQVVVLSVESGELQILEPMETADGEGESVEAVWSAGNDEIEVTRVNKKRHGTRKTYQVSYGKWACARTETIDGSDPAMLMRPDALRVEFHQSVNEPATVRLSSTERSRILMRSDQGLEAVKRARVESFTWHDGKGEAVTGGLALPEPALKQEKLPLVIQIKFAANEFLPDGTNSTGYAMQALVAQGFAVLQMPFEDLLAEKYTVTQIEGQVVQDRIDSGTLALAESKGIHLTRERNIGNSRAGNESLFAVTHPVRVKYAAAACLDSTNLSFPEHIADAINIADFPLSVLEAEKVYHTPFYANMQAWMERDPIFNMHRIEAPVLIQAYHQSGASLYDVDIGVSMQIGALQLARRPFDVYFFPTAIHNLNRPRERLAAMELTIDWMNFWMQGKKIQLQKRRSNTGVGVSSAPSGESSKLGNWPETL